MSLYLQNILYIVVYSFVKMLTPNLLYQAQFDKEYLVIKAKWAYAKCSKIKNKKTKK